MMRGISRQRRDRPMDDAEGPGWEAIADGIDGPEGWPLYLDRYAALLKEDR